MSAIHVTLTLALVPLAIAASGVGAQEPATVLTEMEFKTLIEAPPLPNTQCEAVASISYHQRNTVARVETTIEVADCTKAAGELTVALRVRDESRAIKPLEFSATWQRSDDQNLSVTADYPIGENVELMSVRVRGLRCRCADPPEVPAEN
jgi:hypothetical protein